MSDNWFNPEIHTKTLSVGNTVSILGDIPKRSVGYASWLSEYKNVVIGVPSASTYRPTYTKMKPVVDKVQELYDFVATMATLFTEQLGVLVKFPNATESGCVVLKLLDIVVVLNFLKMFNSALINDFAMFKRSFQQVRGELPPDECEAVAQQSHTLHFFLANPNSVLDHLREALSELTATETGLSRAIHVGVDTLIAHTHTKTLTLSPAEHAALLRALVYAISLQDSATFNPFSQKDTWIKPLKQFVKSNADVHVHGSLSMSCVVVLRTTSHWQPAMEHEWVGTDDNSVLSSCVCV